jgi:hydrogenase maturation protease
MNKRILVLGLGNILISDEGLGVHALRWLEANCKLPPEVELVDGGTGGLSLLPLLSSVDVLIVIDAITLGKEPGTIYCFSEEILTNQSLLEKISTHEISFADILSILQLKGDKPKKIFLLGMEPKSLEVGTELSEEVKKNIPKLCQLVLEKINESMP